MPLSRAEKEVIVTQMAEVASNAISAAAAEYRGLTVAEMTELRAKAREAGVFLKIVPNTLAKRAVNDTSFECMQDALVGPLILAFAEEAPGSAARLFRDYAKQNKKLVVKILAVSGQLYDVNNLDVVADLPTRDEALAQLLSVMKAPVGKFVRTLAAPHAKFVRTLDAVREKRQAEGE